jgi:glycosyltransferase involved in cell wall biosynthesis
MVRLERRGHEVLVLCGDTRLDGERQAPEPDHETRVRRTLRLYHDGAAILHPPWRERLAIERHNQRELERAIAEVRPDVISVWHLAGASHGLLATIARSGIPVVFAVCDDWLVYGVRLDAWAAPFDRSPLHRTAGRVVARLAGVPCTVPDIGRLGPFLFVSRATEAAALERARWHPARRDVVWSGIDLATYPTPEDRVDRPWRWRLVTTGRFDPRKGFETVVRALPLLPPEATLAIWGRGGEAEQERLRRVAADLGVAHRVRFGSLERDELSAAYADADVMVFPSSWAEPFGLVPVEAMACDTPVLATRVGGSAEFLHAGINCLAFAAGDSVGLAGALGRLAGDPALRARLVEAGRATVELLDVERLADVMEAWHVHEATDPAGPPPATRRGVPAAAPHMCTLRLARGEAIVTVGATDRGAVVVDPAALPVRSGAVARARLRLEGAAPVALAASVAEQARIVRPGGALSLDAPNPRDLRRVRTALRSWWQGWHRPPPVPPGAVDLAAATAALSPYGEVVHAGTGTWDGSALGRAAGRLARAARVAGRGPRTDVEVRRR